MDAGDVDAGDVDSGVPDSGVTDAGADAGTDAGLDSGVIFGLDARPANTTCIAPNPPPSTSTVTTQRVFTSLTFNQPLGLFNDGGDCQLTDELIAAVIAEVRPHRPNGKSQAWETIAAAA